MELHANAALSLNKRRQLARRGGRGGLVAHRGEAGLLDRPSAPGRVWNRTCERRIEAIAALRRLRMTGAQIAAVLGMPESRPCPES